MRLPAKFIPQHSQRLGNVIGAIVTILVGWFFLNGSLPSEKPKPGESFSHWLSDGSPPQLVFLIVIIAMVLFGLGALAVALVDLIGGSPFSSVVVDRFGIRVRSLTSERSLSWKDLGPIRVYRRSPLRSLSMSRRFWIVSDTFSGEDRNDLRRGLGSFTLRISAGAYLSRDLLGGGVEPEAEATAAWLESLRQLAREDRLDSANAPDAPDALSSAASTDSAAEAAATGAGSAATATLSDLPPMEERKFGRRSDPTVER
jgi:hypothetical protein